MSPLAAAGRTLILSGLLVMTYLAFRGYLAPELLNDFLQRGVLNTFC